MLEAWRKGNLRLSDEMAAGAFCAALGEFDGLNLAALCRFYGLPEPTP
jgi:hypothetical protein